MSKVLEAPIEGTVCDIAKANGWLVRKLSWPGRRGAPDRLFAKVFPCGKIRHVLIEFKRPGAPPMKRQNSEHVELVSAGFAVHVCDSINQALNILEI